MRKPSEGRRPFGWIRTLHCPVVHTVALIYPRNKLGPIYQLSVSRNSVFQDGISALLKLPNVHIKRMQEETLENARRTQRRQSRRETVLEARER